MALLAHLCVMCLVVASSEYEVTNHIYAWAGQNVTLKCVIFNNPHIKQWRRGRGTSFTVYTDNKYVINNLQHRLNISNYNNEYNLHIYDVIPNDSDVYTCIAKKDGDDFYLQVTLNVSELTEQNTEKAKISFSIKISYLFGGIIGAVVVILFCASLLFLFANKNRESKEASLDTHHAPSWNTDSQQNPYDEIDEETASSLATRRTDNKNCPSSNLNVLNHDFLQSVINTYELIEGDVVTPGLNIAIASGSCAKVGPKGGLPQNEYHIYDEVTDELIPKVYKVSCIGTVKQTEYYNSNQGSVNSRMTNEIDRNTYQALQPNWQTPPRLYSRLTHDNL